MSESKANRSELAPPHAADPSAPLVEDQGVNASDDDPADAPGAGTGVESKGQGDAGKAPDPHGLTAGYPDQADDGEWVGVPGTDPNEPSQEYGTSGQDSGSMD